MTKNNRLLNLQSYVDITEYDFKEYKPRESLHNDVLRVAGGIYSFNAPKAVAYVFSVNRNGSAINWGSFEWAKLNPRLIYGDIFFMLDTVEDLEKGKYYKLR